MRVFYKNKEYDVSEEAYIISEKGKYSLFSSENIEVLEEAIGNTRFAREFSCGYSQEEHTRLVDKYTKVVKPINFVKNDENVIVTFSNFEEFCLGAFDGYHISKQNNIKNVLRGGTIEVTKEELLLGLKRGLREKILSNKQFRKNIEWRGEDSIKKIERYRKNKKIIENLF